MALYSGCPRKMFCSPYVWTKFHESSWNTISCKACTVRLRIWNQPLRPSTLVSQLQGESKIGTWVSLISTSYKPLLDQPSSQTCPNSTWLDLFKDVADCGLRQCHAMLTVLHITISWTGDNVWTIALSWRAIRRRSLTRIKKSGVGKGDCTPAVELS